MSSNRYKWAAKFPSKGLSAFDVGEHFAHLESANGDLTPVIVLDDAREKNSPTHSFFDWNDTVAADKWRLRQASSLIQNIRVTVKTQDMPEPAEVRAFVRVAGDEESKRGRYVSVNVAMSDEDQRHAVIQSALAELRAFKRKYRDIEELAGVLASMDLFIEAA